MILFRLNNLTEWLRVRVAYLGHFKYVIVYASGSRREKIDCKPVGVSADR